MTTEIQKFDPEMLVRRGNYLVLITPEVAGQLLERNTNNRRPKRRAIANYVRDMRAGNWDPDASDIKVARTLELIDGQNRCMASIEAGVPFPTLLRTCVDLDTKDHVDQGVRRTGADTLSMHDVPDSLHVASGITLRARYERTIREFGGRRSSGTAHRINMTHQEVRDYLEAHPALVKYGQPLSHSLYKIGPGVSRGVWIAFVSMIAESSETMTREFVDTFVAGTSTGTGDPMLALARYLARAQAAKTNSFKSRDNAIRNLLALVKTWNAWIEKEPVELLSVKENETLVAPI